MSSVFGKRASEDSLAGPGPRRRPPWAPTGPKLTHDDIWATISSLDDISAIAARKAQEAKLRREAKRVTNFDSHVRQVESWCSTEVVDRRLSNIPFYRFEKILARVEKIREQACSPNTNFGTRVSAMKALCEIAESICRHAHGHVGCNIGGIFKNHGEIEAAMISVLACVSREMRLQLGQSRYEDGIHVLPRFRALAAIGHQEGLFDPMPEVICLLYDDQATINAEGRVITYQTRAVGGPTAIKEERYNVEHLRAAVKHEHIRQDQSIAKQEACVIKMEEPNVVQQSRAPASLLSRHEHIAQGEIVVKQEPVIIKKEESDDGNH
ncbi:hypothetical protein BDV96DRAFT_653011 [Lophiotrema nucula]|uniref:Uncharacterized protein n=1 Tax=Lophiotrema nucula TaxID=690887 RepID=A0A6A5YNZ3_9PLEO|nr:hypothetical protein BDV96DRAFT_653011 [Lophiotrema nucula]